MTDERFPSEIDKYLKVAQVAKTFRVQPQTVRNWIAEGRLPSYRLVGRSYMVHEDDVKTLLEATFGPKGANRP